MSPQRQRTLYQVCLIFLLGGCAGEPLVEPAVLPFHVAVIPIAVDARGDEVLGANELQLRITDRALARALADTLARECFTRVSLLPRPPGEEWQAFARKSSGDREAHWIAAAERVQADLILEAELSYQGRIRLDRDETFWINLVLFSLGGPFCYFLEDVNYSMYLSLTSSIYDVQQLGRMAHLENDETSVVPLNTNVSGDALNFLDRAGTNIGLYLASLVVPSGVLANRSQTAERKLNERALAQVARNIVNEIRQKRDLILNGKRLRFKLVPETVEFAYAGDNRIDVRADVLLEKGHGVDRLDEYLVWSGDLPTSSSLWARGDFSDGELVAGRPNTERYRIHARIPVAAAESPRYVRLLIRDGSANRNVRTYTLALPGGELMEIGGR